MKHSKKISIRWKLFLYFILFTAVILVLLWLMQVVFLEPIYKMIKVNEIKTTAKSLSKNIDREDFFEYSFNLAEQNEICILAYKLVRTSIVIRPYEYLSVDVLPDCAIHKINMAGIQTLYNSAVSNESELLQYYVYDSINRRYESVDSNTTFMRNGVDSVEVIIYTQLLTNSAGDEILLMVNSVISPVNATIKTLNMQLIVISVLLIILAVILTFIFARRISVPIVTINKSAKILATGNYNVEFSGGGYKEITELAETLNYAAVELSKIDKMKSDLIANISHDLRTPLTMIVGYSEVMRDIPDENTPENIQIIIDEANRLTSLVNDVLDISKLQSGRYNFVSEPFNLTAALKNALLRYNKLTEQDGYTIDFIYDDVIEITSDETRIMQAFYNLVNNAVTYTGADKHVTVVQTVSNGFVRISIKDTGDGIEADKLPFIWDRYYKIDKVHKRASVGTGLGLSIVKSIINAAGGHYGVDSTVGAGSTFWIELPIVE